MSPHGLHEQEQEQDPIETLIAQLPPDLRDSRDVPIVASQVRRALAELAKCPPGTVLDDEVSWWQRTVLALLHAGLDLSPWLAGEAPDVAAEFEREMRAQAANDTEVPNPSEPANTNGVDPPQAETYEVTDDEVDDPTPPRAKKPPGKKRERASTADIEALLELAGLKRLNFLSSAEQIASSLEALALNCVDLNPKARALAKARAIEVLDAAGVTNAKEIVDTAFAEVGRRKSDLEVRAYATDPIVALLTTEAGSAQLFAVWARRRLRHVEDAGTWAEWTGTHWSMRAGWSPTDVFTQWVATQYEKYRFNDGDDEKTKANKAAARAALHRMSGARCIANVLHLAKPHLHVMRADFDADPWALNTPIGVVNLRDGSMSGHDPALLLSRITAASPAAGPMPTWRETLDACHPGDADTIAMLLERLAVMLSGVSITKLMIAFGDGFNGKSVTIQVLTALAGDYAGSLPPSAILKAKGGHQPHTGNIGQAIGKRFLALDELPHPCEIDMGAVKRLSAGTKASVQTNIGKSYVDVVLRFNIFVCCNHLPRLADSDGGTADRVEVIPFNVDLAKTHKWKRDPGFVARVVAAEGPAILADLIERCARWHERGDLVTSKAVIEATQEYFADEHEEIPFEVGCFISQYCTVDPKIDKGTESNELYARFTLWLGVRSPTKKAPSSYEFRKHVKLLFPGCRIKRLRDGGPKKHLWVGLKLNPFEPSLGPAGPAAGGVKS
jgi:P4 family phage/plasmid primase-like protien